MLYTIFSVIAPVFICALIGYGWVKKGLAFDTPFVSRLVMDVGAPCLVFSSMMEQNIDLTAFGQMALAAFLAMIAFGAIAAAVLQLTNQDLRTWLPAQMFPNVGNMGLPLCILAFKSEGQALGMTYFMVNVLFGFTLGAMITSGKLSLRELFRNSTFYAVLITLAFVLTGTKPPAWAQNTIKLLAGFTIPLMLIAMGVSLARFRITSLRRSLLLSVLRIGMGFGVGVALAQSFGMSGAARGVMILQSAMPVAVFAYMFAVRYNRDPEEVASTVVISTLLSFLSLPALLWFVL
ncbi:MAG TPA: AEC family transporter [Candidatus Acidoferrum sp.]|nr:AEC family transporter [Candidatus Acidoferrum sp.]